MGIIEKRYKKDSAKRAIAVMLGILFNLCVSYIVNRFNLPLYLDTIGTIAVSALGGIFPGIMTAVVTNLSCSIYNSYSIYYVLINVLIAICTSWFVRYKKYKKTTRFILYLLLISGISGIVGSIFQWVMLGQMQFEDVTQAAEVIANTTGINFFFGAIIANTGLNILDKGISCLVAFLVVFLIPEKQKQIIWDSGWKQTPLSDREIREYGKKNKKIKISLNKRMTGLLIFAAVSMAFIMAFCGLSLYSKNIRHEYEEKAKNAAVYGATIIDGNNIDTYVSDGKRIYEYDNENYQKERKLLDAYRESLTGVASINVYQVKKDGYHLVFSTDQEKQEKNNIGMIIPFDENIKPYISTLFAGEPLGVLEKNTKSGKYLTAYEPVYNSIGKCVAYVTADASLSFVGNYMNDFILKVLFVFVGFMVLIVAYGFWVTGFDLVYPVKSMAFHTNNFIRHDIDQETLDNNVKRIRELNIHTGDEIENLYNSICKMAIGMAEQMRDIRHYADSTAKMQNGLIITMADMVENRDSDTGAHIQKTAEYVRIILEGLKRKGYYTEKLTPKYMTDVEMSAPLHDVGKINIPDAVLNKPGKLTDQEFEIMKTHTTIGKNIMEKAISTVRGESYLKEARNMAGYHHERWDGKGYPEGLHGNVIPLSARIMAVADVFDALTSARVYKPAFPLEKALKIIQEGSGTQFDPKCVEVFMDSLDEVKLVLRKYQNS